MQIRDERRKCDLRPHSCTFTRFTRDLSKELRRNFPNAWRQLSCANGLIEIDARQPASDASLQALLQSKHLINVCSVDEFFINFFEALATQVCEYMLAHSMHYIVLELEDQNGDIVFQHGQELEVQAGDEICEDSPSNTTAHEAITSFYDQNPSYTCGVKSQLDPTFHISHDQDASFSEFFSRPVEIATYTWTIGTTFSNFLQPWNAYMSNPRVSNRLNNFRILSSKLHVRVQISGNGFYYGRVLVSYTPELVSWDNIVGSGDSFTTTRAILGDVDLIAASQRPHIFLDPSTSQGGEMVLPFFHYANGLDLVANSVAISQNMGELWFQSFGPLLHANAGTSPIRVAVFAWMSDVVLSAPTDLNFGGLSPQSGLEVQAADEYGIGPVSRPANIVAATAGRLINFPALRPYAMATQIAAEGVSAIASYFGFSRPADISAVQTRRVSVVGDLASTTREDTLMRLSLDAKQEVTVDPRTAGLADVDELSLDYICAKESYLVQAPWATTAAQGDCLFSTQVRPEMFGTYSAGVGSTTEIHMTPCCWASVPFRYWRGKMKYRFQVVASGYHKGKLRLCWDPIYTGSNPDFNTCYNRIVDLAEERDFEIEIGWGQPNPYLLCANSTSSDWDTPHFTLGSPALASSDFANGVLSLFVQNELVAPNTPTPISVNVFVSMVEPEFASPYGLKLSYFTWFGIDPNLPPVAPIVQQAGQEVEDSDANSTKKPSVPMAPQSLMAPVDNDRMVGVECITMGEKITSFRQLLKRYNFSYFDASEPTLVGSTYSLVSHERHAFPIYRGYAPGAAALSPALEFNPVANTLLNYTVPLFAGWRGAIRWKHIYANNCNNCDFIFTSMRNASNCTYLNTADSSNTLTTVGTSVLVDIIGNAWEGIAATTTRVNPSIEVEIPYQCPVRFRAARKGNQTTDPSNGMGYINRFFGRGDSATPFVTASYVAVGEDFSAFFFSGVPRIFYLDYSP